jgi:hypothetical protein
MDDSMQITIGRLERMTSTTEFENQGRIPMQLFLRILSSWELMDTV